MSSLESVMLASDEYWIDILVSDILEGYNYAPKIKEDVEEWMEGLSLLSYTTVCSFIGDGSASDDAVDIHYSYRIVNSLFNEATRQVRGPSKKLSRGELVCCEWGVNGLYSIEDFNNILIFTFTGDLIYISKCDLFCILCDV
jgi:hypothetical protein